MTLRKFPIFIGVFALSLLFSLPLSTATAQTTGSYDQQIAALQAQIVSLQAQVNSLLGQSSGSGIGSTVQSLNLGDSVRTTDDVNVRATANGSLIGVQKLGATGVIVGGPTTSGGHVWWNINYTSGTDGWSSGEFLIKVTGTTPSGTTTSTPCPAPTGTTGTTGTQTGTANEGTQPTTYFNVATGQTEECPSTPTTPSSAKFQKGDRVATTDRVNGRASYNTSAQVLLTAPSGAQGVISSGPQTGNGYTWWYVFFDQVYGVSREGWVVEGYLVKVTPTSPPTIPLPPGPYKDPCININLPGTYLSSGMISDEVFKLQYALIKLGFLGNTTVSSGNQYANFQARAARVGIPLTPAYDNASGLFGNLTRTAVTEFNKSYGISIGVIGATVYEYAGVATVQKVKELTCGPVSTPPLPATPPTGTTTHPTPTTPPSVSITDPTANTTWYIGDPAQVCWNTLDVASNAGGFINLVGPLPGNIAKRIASVSNLSNCYLWPKVGTAPGVTIDPAKYNLEVTFLSLKGTVGPITIAEKITTPPVPTTPTTPTTPLPPVSSKFQIGDRVIATANLNVRTFPSTTSNLLNQAAPMPQGSTGTVAAGPTSANGYVWWQIKYDGNQFGWSIETYLEKFVGATPVGPITPPTPTTPVSASIDIKANGSDGVLYIMPGYTLTLSWTSTNLPAGTACNLKDWGGVPVAIGTISYTPAHSQYPTTATAGTIYSISCTLPTGQIVSDSVTVALAVDYPPPTPTSSVITVKANGQIGPKVTIGSGASFVLSWTNASNAGSCSVTSSWPGFVFYNLSPNSSLLAVSPGTNGYPSTMGSLYTVTCGGSSGSITVYSSADQTPTDKYWVVLKANGLNPTGATVGFVTQGYDKDLILSWISNLQVCTLFTPMDSTFSGVGGLLPNGSYKISAGQKGYPSPTGTIYRVSCIDGSANSNSDDVEVRLVYPDPFPPIIPVIPTAPAAASIDIKANGSDGPLTFTQGNTLTLSWASTNLPAGTSCNLKNWGGVPVAIGTISYTPVDSQYPTTGGTIYSISCTLPTGQIVSDGVTVNLAAYSSPIPPLSANKFQIGDKVKATANVYTRVLPSTSSLGSVVPNGLLGSISSGPKSGSGFTWWQVQWDTSAFGWSVEDYLEKVTVLSSPSNTGTTYLDTFGQPDRVKIGIRDGILPPSNGVYGTEYFMYAGGNSKFYAEQMAKWVALVDSWEAARASAGGTLNLPPDQLLINLANNRWGMPDTVSQSAVDRYAAAYKKYFAEFLPVFKSLYAQSSASTYAGAGSSSQIASILVGV